MGLFLKKKSVLRWYFFGVEVKVNDVVKIFVDFKLNWYIVKLIFVVGFGGFFFGYDIGIKSYF